MQYDVFVSHASEDKESVARPLTLLLQEAGLRVWLDAFEISVGDSLRRTIDAGLAQSRFGVVIVSAAFLRKEWPNKELDGLVARERKAEKVILPVWHNITAEEIAERSPLLADRLAVSTANGLGHVADELLKTIRRTDPAMAKDGREVPEGRRRRRARVVAWFALPALIALLAVGAWIGLRKVSPPSQPPTSHHDIGAQLGPDLLVARDASTAPATSVASSRAAASASMPPAMLAPSISLATSHQKRRVAIRRPMVSPPDAARSASLAERLRSIEEARYRECSKFRDTDLALTACLKLFDARLEKEKQRDHGMSNDSPSGK
jgi:hypothetical protein